MIRLPLPKASTRFRYRALLLSLTACPLIACGGSARTTSEDRALAGASSGGSLGQGGASGAAAIAGATVITGGATSEAGSAGAVGTVPLAPGSWNVTAQITSSKALSGSCPSVDFTLNLSPQQLITVGSNGQMDEAQSQSADGGALVERLSLPTASSSTGCSATELTVEQLRLSGVDSDGDGQTDAIAGFATGTVEFRGGDVIFDDPVSVALNGTLDRRAPELIVPAFTFNPLNPPNVIATEPLDVATSLELVGTTTTPLVSPSDDSNASDAPSGAISWSSAAILPLSGEWQIQGQGRDLSGLPLARTGTLSTLQDPGVCPQDGFESDLIAAVGGAPKIVGQIGELAAIAGVHSLLVRGGDALTFHLQRAAAETTLRFSLRALGPSADSFNFAKEVRVGVVGSQSVSRVVLPRPQEAAVSTGDSDLPWASPVVEVSAPLSPGGKDVLLYIADYACGGGLCPPPAVLLLDELRLD